MSSKSLKNSGLKKNNTTTLSLCMIVRNEEAVLDRCLRSVKDVVDEMIIVDTGSEDRTVEIAESHGARVYHHPWQNSFSEARNHGLQFATGDWILQMDADEELEREDIPLVKAAISSDRYDVVFVALLNDSPEGWSKHYFQRIFRRGRAHYEGIVHNQLCYEGAHLRTEIRIYHYGYNLSEDKMEEKFRRTEALLLNQIESDETHPFVYQNYIRILRARKRYDEAIRQGRKAMAICKERMGAVHKQMLAYDVAYCQMVSGRPEEAETLCREILAEYPENLDILYTLGAVLVTLEKFEEAVHAFHAYLDVQVRQKAKPEHTRLIVDTYDFDHKAWGHLSDCYFKLGACEESRKAAEQAIALRPECAMYKIGLARALSAESRFEEAKNMLQEEGETGQADSDFFMKWSTLNKMFPALGDRAEPIRQGLCRYPESAELHNCLAYVLAQEDENEAEAEWLKVLERNADHVGARLGLARIYAKHGEIGKLKEQAGRILARPTGKETLKEIGGYCIWTQQYETAIRLFSQYLMLEPADMEVLSDIATCYAKMGQYQASLVGYKAALCISPNNPVIMKNIRKLHRIIEQLQPGEPA